MRRLIPSAKHNWLDYNRFNSFFNLFDDNAFTKLNKEEPSFDVDIKENDNSYELIANLPGISKENITIDYNNNYRYAKKKRMCI